MYEKNLMCLDYVMNIILKIKIVNKVFWEKLRNDFNWYSIYRIIRYMKEKF